MSYNTSMKMFLASLFLYVFSNVQVAAAPERYNLVREQSSVRFAVGFGPDRITGTFPVRAADIVLDFVSPPNSRVAVELDASRAAASFPFANQALRGPKVLATDAFPTLRFSTTDLRADGRRAKVRGDITIRGTTRPLVLDAQIYRSQGSASGDLSRLSIHLSGSVKRSAFGATGWADMVDDVVQLDIVVRIRRVD